MKHKTQQAQDEAEEIEARIRWLMAMHAATSDRGFDTHAERAAWHVEIDGLLDELARMA